jgi:hypothetical protein
MFCREQAVQLHRERETIRRKGAGLVFVGNGNRRFARGFVEQFGIEAPVYVDPKLVAYRALEFSRPVLGLFNPKVWVAGARALGGGARQGTVQGDAFQLGGVLVVRKDATVAYRHASATAGDHPPVAEVLAAL